MADLSLQLQADNLPQDIVEELFVDGHWAPILTRLRSGENLLIEGCRGEGKTMLMRAAASRMAREVPAGGKSLGIHATFKRYLATIPPPGYGASPELGNFKAWVNARILGALRQQVEAVYGEQATKATGMVGRVDWTKLIAFLETTYRGAAGIVGQAFPREAGLTEAEFQALQGYTLTVDSLRAVRKMFDLELLVLLLDDAAHALDTRAQGEFFTLIKSLYTDGLAFKISVYPAVTRYGLDFSYGHDAAVVSLGQIPKPDRMTSYYDLLERRLRIAGPDGGARDLVAHLLHTHKEWVRLLVYCANGNPRGLLKLLSQLLTELGERPASSVRYEDVRSAVNYVMDRHLDNMVPGIIKDLDPRLLSAAHLLLDAFREKLRDSPGPLQGNQSRMFLAITNSMQIPYLCTAATRLLVAANVLSPEGPARLGTRTRENGTVFLLHPGFVFRDNVLSSGGGLAPVEKWLQHFDTMSPRVHAEISKTAPLWEEVRKEANQEPRGRCLNGHPMQDTAIPCEHCGAPVEPRGPAIVLLNKDINVLDLSFSIKQRLRAAGYSTVRQVFEADAEQLDDIPYIGERRLAEIRSAVEAAVDEFFAG